MTGRRETRAGRPGAQHGPPAVSPAAGGLAVAGSRDYAAELGAWLDSTAGAVVQKVGKDRWAGSVPVSGGARLYAGLVPHSRLLAAMQEAASRARACRAVEAAWPGWSATVALDGAWVAWRDAGDGGLDRVTAGDEAGLLAAVAVAVAAPGTGWWDALEAADEVNAGHGPGTVLAVPLAAGGFGLAVPLGDPRVALPADAARRWLAAGDAPAGEGAPQFSPAGQDG